MENTPLDKVKRYRKNENSKINSKHFYRYNSDTYIENVIISVLIYQVSNFVVIVKLNFSIILWRMKSKLD